MDVALRINNVRLFSPNLVNNYKLKALSWLMGFRLLLLAIYSGRVIVNEVDKQVCESKINKVSSKESKDENSNNNNNPNIIRKCWLCIDQLRDPSCLPCGHIYCWDCILDYCYNDDNLSLKCPVCRSAFKKQSIRALHGY